MSDFLRFIVVEHIRFFHGALQFSELNFNFCGDYNFGVIHKNDFDLFVLW